MTQNNIQIPAHMCMPTFRKDRCGTVKFTSTRELTKEEREILLEAGVNDEMGWVLWSPNKMQVDDLPTEPATDDRKTPAQRQRSLLFLIWKRHGSKGDFNTYYRERIEKNLERLKLELDGTV